MIFLASSLKNDTSVQRRLFKEDFTEVQSRCPTMVGMYTADLVPTYS